jgi:hypothetical protein
MNTSTSIQTLNELLRLLCRSLPAYLADAKPWALSASQATGSAFDHLVSDQQRYARRVSDAITELGGRPDPGRFAMTLTAKNDLSWEFLQQEVIRQQEQDVLAIEQCAAQLEDNSMLHSLAEEILGNARGHLDILRETVSDER